MIIPHIIDQFVWNKRLFNLKVSPNGIPIGKIARKNLEPKIDQLMHDDDLKERMMQLAQQMRQEDFRLQLYNSLIE